MAIALVPVENRKIHLRAGRVLPRMPCGDRLQPKEEVAYHL